MKKYKDTLIRQERGEREALGSTGMQNSYNVLHALILPACDEGLFRTRVLDQRDHFKGLEREHEKH